MISKIKISALKSIDTLEMKCTKLNIIAGTNSSGKSTLFHALLLFFQSYPGAVRTLSQPNGLNGSFISLGEFRENRNSSVTNDTISIGLNFDNAGAGFAEVYFQENDNLECCVSDNYYTDIADSVRGDSNTDGYGEITNKLKFLSCNRIGAQDTFNKNYSNEGIGHNGEYAVYYYERNKTKVLEQGLIKDATSETLAAQVNFWLDYIVNTTINTEDIKGTDIVKASYSVKESRNSRPRNVGSGISYLISVLILCLSSDVDDVLVIENPEIHLHPRAQSKVCEFLYFIAKTGRQIFVETHSDHVFNGIRAGIATGEIDTKDISVNFFELDDKNCTKNTVVEFGKRGRILNYTNGLFDQFDIDLNRMLDI